ncbi:trypsin-like serine peptidase [Staphylococcus caeli]|uniref:Serine protease n=1 Tax=Staphylococcus caeli TaxID=2201815 RepID=A0A1D4HUS6_9STAP|nr:serine protease [Staphylococcus caeli]SCS40902.1 glutamyl endopeptidase precursor [Staphylococcus caeli]SCS59337.1 glutamyl endopeptidase precursor [Staphylococcus caeli]
MILRKIFGGIALMILLLVSALPLSTQTVTAARNNTVNKPMPRVVLPNEDRTQIQETTSGHYQSVGYINIGNKIATGVVIDKNTVLTNKHVANGSNGNMTFAPAAKDENTFPYGTFTEKEVKAYPGNEDIVIVHFNENEAGQSIGDVVQTATIKDAADVTKDAPITVTGYPGDKALATMWESKGAVLENNGTQFTYNASTFGGNSGSPVFNSSNEVIGIHQGGIEGESNSAVAISGEVLNFINENRS